MKNNGCFELLLRCISCSLEFTRYTRVYEIPNFVLLKMCPKCGDTESKLVDYWYKNSIKGRKKVKLEHYTRSEWSDGGQGMVYGNVSINLGYGIDNKVLFYSDPASWIVLLK
jgi:hypothetical protein